MSVWYNCFLFLFVLCKQEPSSCHLSLFVFLLLIRYMFSWMKFRMAPRSYFNKMREIYREKRELGRERQKVFFSFACYLNTVCIHFFLRVAFVYMNKSLEDARQLTTTFTHFRIAAYTSSRARKLMAMFGCSLLNSFLSFPTRFRIVMRKSKIVVKDRCDQL